MSSITDRLICIRSLLFVGLLAGGSGVAASPGASQYQSLLPADARLVKESHKELGRQQVVLGALENVRNEVVPEHQEFFTGTRHRSTYILPEARSTDDVKDFVLQQVVNSGDLLFECHGRRCGSSNSWANIIFKQSILYGPEQYQHYLAVRYSGEEEQVVLVYIAERGTGDIYLQMDVVKMEAPVAARPALTGMSSMRGRLLASGKVMIPMDQLETVAGELLQLMQARPDIKVWVVGHQRLVGRESVTGAMAQSEKAAVRFVTRLTESGVSPDRMAAYGIGPLAPSDRSKASSYIEIILQPPVPG